MPSNDLFDFMKRVTDELSSEYVRIQKRSVENSGTAGDQGEENWADLLRSWLPPIFRVVTKGRIMNEEGIVSGQMDVIVLDETYPKFLVDKKLYLAGGIAAVFECKNTLKRDHIFTFTKKISGIQKLLQPRSGTPYKELYSPIVCGLLAHSHSWKAKSSNPVQKIDSLLRIADETHVNHPRELIDVVCVADVATWYASKTTFMRPEWLPISSPFAF